MRLSDSRSESGCHPCQRFADNIRKAPVASKRRGWTSGGVSSAISGSRAGGMYRNYNCPFRFCVKRFGRVLVPLSSGSAALGAPFLGSGQPVDDKGGPAGRKGGFRCNELGDRRTLRRCAVGGGSKAGGGLWRDALGGEARPVDVPRSFAAGVEDDDHRHYAAASSTS